MTSQTHLQMHHDRPNIECNTQTIRHVIDSHLHIVASSRGSFAYQNVFHGEGGDDVLKS